MTVLGLGDFFDKKGKDRYTYYMSSTPKQVLNNINNSLKKNLWLIEPFSHRWFLTNDEYENYKKDIWHVKHVSESSMRISLANEALSTSKIMTCIPIIIQDQLNWYAALWHYSESLIGSTNHNNELRETLSQIAHWSLVIKLLYKEWSCNVDDLIYKLHQVRDDIISIESIKLEGIDRKYYDVLYNPKRWDIFVTSNWYEDKVYHIDWLRRWISKKVPQYEQLRWYFAQNIANTFFL